VLGVGAGLLLASSGTTCCFPETYSRQILQNLVHVGATLIVLLRTDQLQLHKSIAVLLHVSTFKLKPSCAKDFYCVVCALVAADTGALLGRCTICQQWTTFKMPTSTDACICSAWSPSQLAC
jgi:hypothetical protein